MSEEEKRPILKKASKAMLTLGGGVGAGYLTVLLSFQQKADAQIEYNRLTEQQTRLWNAHDGLRREVKVDLRENIRDLRRDFNKRFDSLEGKLDKLLEKK